MNIYLNGEKRTVPASGNINDFFSHLKLEPAKGYAVAVNDAVIPKSEWSRYALKDNDNILLIKATQGG
jgi:sulfur carrier protein